MERNGRPASLHSAVCCSRNSVLQSHRKAIKQLYTSSSSSCYVVVNVSGRRFRIEKHVLERFPDTLLGGQRRHSYFDTRKQEFFFDRDPDIFAYILKFYRTGKVHYPENECTELFECELKFFGIFPQCIGLCCAEYFDTGQTKIEKCRHLTKETARIKLNKAKTLKDYRNFKQKLWFIFEQPTSSTPGLILWIVTTLFIVITVVSLVMETVPKDEKTWGETHPTEFYVSNSICVIYFTVEYIIKLYASPNRWKFVKQMSNIIDLVSILPYYIGLAAGDNNNSKFLVILRVLRVTRVVKISRFSAEKMHEHSEMLKQNRGELAPLLLCFATVLIIFSSVIYYLEILENNSRFPSIPSTFWYTIVTMTSLGYGDLVPDTVPGKIVGAVCSLSGLFLIALMAPLLQKN